WRGALGSSVHGPVSRESRPGEHGELNPPRTLETTWVPTTNGHERATTDETFAVAGPPPAHHSRLITEPLRPTSHVPRPPSNANTSNRRLRSSHATARSLRPEKAWRRTRTCRRCVSR